MERDLPRDVSRLGELFAFVHEFCGRIGAGEEDVHAADLVAEEIFTNLVKYNPDAPGEITLRLARKDDSLQIVFVDRDVEPFDPTTAPDVPPDYSGELRPGGLGLHIIRRMTDDLHYHYEDRTSTITAVRKLKK